MTTDTTPQRKSRRSETVRQFVTAAQARSGLYVECLGEDIAGKLAHHAERMAHHHRAYIAELVRIHEACRELGIQLPS